MRRMVVATATVLAALGVLAAPVANAGAVPSTKAKVSGTVDVLYAGSFLDLMEQRADFEHLLLDMADRLPARAMIAQCWIWACRIN